MNRQGRLYHDQSCRTALNKSYRDVRIIAIELGIRRQIQATDDGSDQIVGGDDLDLTVDEAGVDQCVGCAVILVEHLRLAGVHQDARVRRIHRRRGQEVNEADR